MYPSVLLVADDRLSRQMLLENLVVTGFSVSEAETAGEGLILAPQATPELVLLDLQRSASDCLESCRQFRTEVGTAGILLIAGKKEIRAGADPFAAGADDYLLRPIEGWEVALRLQAMWRRRQAGEEQARQAGQWQAAQEESARLRKAVSGLRSGNERLRRVDRLRSDFLNTAAHELRIPVTILNGYLSLLNEIGTGNLTDDQREYLQVAQEHSDRMVNLTNDMLDLSRLESGKMEMEIAEGNLRPVILEVCRDFQSLAAKNGIALDAGGVDPCQALFDQGQIRRVLANLLNNAIKFTPQGGKVQIRLAFHEQEAQVAVEDTGPGIPPEKMSQLFKEFVQMSHHDSCKGTGLGLAICKRIIDSHQGKIWAESHPGQGSRFIFTLPRSL
ncbi:MAG: hybrid sensor histidine kinase/response regulator [Desulfuromonadales bacterium]|nr:hybrid sensor histidine kinase/response regulator [Desulfuromonadales bacterium]